MTDVQSQSSLLLPVTALLPGLSTCVDALPSFSMPAILPT